MACNAVGMNPISEKVRIDNKSPISKSVWVMNNILIVLKSDEVWVDSVTALLVDDDSFAFAIVVFTIFRKMAVMAMANNPNMSPNPVGNNNKRFDA